MKLLKRLAYLVSAVMFSSLSLFVYSQAVHANSYFGGNGRITFYSPVTLGDTTKEIYTVKPDGSDLKQITSNSLEDANPQWNPDGNKIAFDEDLGNSTHGHDIYIQSIDTDGSATGSATALTGADTCENEWDPSWSPDGTIVAYHRTSTVRADCSVGDAGGPNHIFTISSDGAGTAEARTGGGGTDADFRDTEATWSRDGDYLVFTRYDLNAPLDCNDDADTADTDDFGRTISVVPADGTEADVVNIAGDNTTCLGSPQWSPTSNTVVYNDGGDIKTATLGEGDNFAYLNSPVVETLVSGANIPYAPTYSPDGKIIATSGNDGIEYFNSTTGESLKTVTISDSLDFLTTDGIHEIDWARAAAPDNNTHDCTIYVNETCSDTEFDPEIPDVCSIGTLSEITTTAKHGTPSYSNGKFSFKPTKDYVGTDKYIYTYYDSNMNAITCTVNITVLPKAPDSGEPPSNTKGMIIGSVMGLSGLSAGYVVKKRRFAKK